MHVGGCTCTWEDAHAHTVQDRVRALCKVDVRIGPQHRVAHLEGTGDVAPLLGPHEEHVARAQSPWR